jgi:GTP-binding protein HflX
LIIDRHGQPVMVILGEPDQIIIPELGRLRQSGGRLRGLRLLHTHLNRDGLTEEDLMDLVFLRLDSIGVLNVSLDGSPLSFQWAQIMPINPGHRPYMVSECLTWDSVDVDFALQAEALEDELFRTSQTFHDAPHHEPALLISVASASKDAQKNSLEELKDLVQTAGLNPVDTLIQRVSRVNPKHIMGKGKLSELEVAALQNGATTLVFDGELTPAQMRNLADITERKILDRTQVILDIFAQHATSRAGKLQVELAQLDYTLPRLIGKNRAMSRLAGGIGGRGPGETKLELDRRRIRERRTRIRKELDKVRRNREATRTRRYNVGLPIVALVGYTNAGKSTLLNTLTHSSVTTADKQFATLDPVSRRLRFPEDQEVILTDTVGFIRSIPENLTEAFKATLEELEAADILIQVSDASHPEVKNQIKAVDAILSELGLEHLPKILALNKWDLLTLDDREKLSLSYPEGIPVTALHRDSLYRLLNAVSSLLPKRIPVTP